MRWALATKNNHQQMLKSGIPFFCRQWLIMAIIIVGCFYPAMIYADSDPDIPEFDIESFADSVYADSSNDVLIDSLIPQAVPFADRPFLPGETFEFTIRYGFVHAGKASLSIVDVDTVANRPCYWIQTKARTRKFFDIFYKVRDEVNSYWDIEYLRSLKHEKRLKEGSYRQHRITLFDFERNIATYKKKLQTKNPKIKEMEIPPNIQDILSAFYYVRMLPLEVGKTAYVDVNADGDNYALKIKVHRKETVKGVLGNTECIVIEPIMRGEAIFKQKGRLLIWLTNDERHIPVKMSSKVLVGAFVADLTGYTPGQP